MSHHLSFYSEAPQPNNMYHLPSCSTFVSSGFQNGRHSGCNKLKESLTYYNFFRHPITNNLWAMHSAIEGQNTKKNTILKSSARTKRKLKSCFYNATAIQLYIVYQVLSALHSGRGQDYVNRTIPLFQRVNRVRQDCQQIHKNIQESHQKPLASKGRSPSWILCPCRAERPSCA